MGGDQFLASGLEGVDGAGQMAQESRLSVIAQSLSICDDDQEKIERPGPVGTSGQPVIPYQALIDPTELSRQLASQLGQEQVFDDRHGVSPVLELVER